MGAGGKLRVSLAILSLAAGPSLATEYHVASGNCVHGTPASLLYNGVTRAANYSTVQACLTALRAGDRCIIHSGTYADNHEVPSTAAGTIGNPTRILGATSDTAILVGNSSQADFNPGGSPSNADNTATLNLKNGTHYVEVGGLTIRTGNDAAIGINFTDNVYVHDINLDDQSRYVLVNREDAVIFAPGTAFFERIRVWNSLHAGSGTDPAAMQIFNLFSTSGSKVRMLDVSDMRGGVDPGHYNSNRLFEFVRVRNFRPWQKVGTIESDDGGVIDSYNSQYSVHRYFSVKEAPGGGAPLNGWFNARRTNYDKSECGSKTPATCGKRVSIYNTNMYLEDAGGKSGYGAWHHDTTTAASQGIMLSDWRTYNSVAQNFPQGILSVGETASNLSSDDCLRFDVGFLAFVGPGIRVSKQIGLPCSSYWNEGIGSIWPTSTSALDHVSTTSTGPLVDAGDNREFVSGVPYFPPPIVSGNLYYDSAVDRIDIGAYEYGAGSWPYEFQVIRSGLPSTPRICWKANASNCDLIIPLWDPSERAASSREGPVQYYWVEIDSNNSFRSGNSSVAPGFGAFHSSGGVNSTNAYYDVPAAAGLQAGQSYYVQVRVGEALYPTTNGNGPGPWSLGFYRFQVAGTSPTNSPPTIHAFSASPASGAAPLNAVLTASASDPNGQTLSYTYAFGDGTSAGPTSLATVLHTYSSLGLHTAQVTVSDGAGGSVSRTVGINVLASVTPTPTPTPTPGGNGPPSPIVQASPTPSSQPTAEGTVLPSESAISDGAVSVASSCGRTSMFDLWALAAVAAWNFSRRRRASKFSTVAN